jgi:hypothetical protein
MLAKYFKKHGRCPCIINTFGFGYSLDSLLLLKIAYFARIFL